VEILGAGRTLSQGDMRFLRFDAMGACV
jgi:hypothetical protein